jgi:hypothetical protein
VLKPASWTVNLKRIHWALGYLTRAEAVIGPQWLTIADENGEPRLQNPNDFFRLEIATALIRGIRVIPILVGEASMPQQTDLPKNIAALAGRNAFRIRDEDFHADVDKLAVQLVNPR